MAMAMAAQQQQQQHSESQLEPEQLPHEQKQIAPTDEAAAELTRQREVEPRRPEQNSSRSR